MVELTRCSHWAGSIYSHGAPSLSFVSLQQFCGRGFNPSTQKCVQGGGGRARWWSPPRDLCPEPFQLSWSPKPDTSTLLPFRDAFVFDPLCSHLLSCIVL